MKKLTVRILSAILCVVIVASCFSVMTSAETVTYRSAANGVSDAYKNSKYYKNLMQVPLTGDGVTDVLGVALSQVGYVEGTNQSGFSGTQGGGGNYTEYCYNMGSVGGYAYAWCAAYVSWCLLQSRCTDQNTQGAWARNHMGDKNYIWREVGCPKWYENLKKCGYGHDASSNYTPKSGDLVFFTGSGHIGIVRYCKNGTVYTIEGNTGNSAGLNPEGGGVYCKNYARSYSKFLGFGSMPYKENANAMKVDYSGENPTTGLWISETVKYLYSDTSLSDAKKIADIPVGTVFEVIKIVSRACYQVKYGDKTGYIKAEGGSPIYQISSTAPASDIPETDPPATEPTVVPNKYAISDELKKVSGHIGSGITKYLVADKSVKESDTLAISSGESVAIEGFAGFSSYIKEFGYYFDSNSENIVWGSIPKEPDANAKKKAGEKAKCFDISADTSLLTSGAHTVTFVVKFLNNKTQDLKTLTLNVNGASGGVGSGSESGGVDDLGCKSSIGMAFALPIALIPCAIIIKKKKED